MGCRSRGCTGVKSMLGVSGFLLAASTPAWSLATIDCTFGGTHPTESSGMQASILMVLRLGSTLLLGGRPALPSAALFVTPCATQDLFIRSCRGESRQLAWGRSAPSSPPAAGMRAELLLLKPASPQRREA